TVASAGDVNRDGYADVMVGAPEYDPDPANYERNGGRIYLYLGSAQGLSPTPAFVLAGYGYDQGFVDGIGRTLVAGDFNGDGFPDIAAGQFAQYVGQAHVYYGSASGYSSHDAWHSGIAIGLGSSVAVADVNGDGFDDLIVTRIWDPSRDLAYFVTPQARVYLGSPTGLSTVSGGDPVPDFVFDNWANVLSVGDLDHDG